MTSGMYALIFAGLAIALLVAMLAPAPASAHDAEPDVPTGLLVGACAATLLMGSLALSGHHLEAVICGAAAWLIVVPCLWLVRAPDGWSEEDEDDDGGSPWPDEPSTPPAPDDRLPGFDPADRTAARGAWIAAPAVAFTPAAAEAPLPAWAMRQGSPAWAMALPPAGEPGLAAGAEDLYDELPITDPVWAPVPVTAPACEQTDAPASWRARRSSLRRRGEHRSVAHVRPRAGHPRSRPHGGGLSRRIVRACRRWLGVESPECRRRALEHGGRRHALRAGSRDRVRRDAVSR